MPWRVAAPERRGIKLLPSLKSPPLARIHFMDALEERLQPPASGRSAVLQPPFGRKFFMGGGATNERHYKPNSAHMVWHAGSD